MRVSLTVYGMTGVATVVHLCNDSTATPGSGLHFNLIGIPWGAQNRGWIVKTESNVRREKRKRPDPPCAVCKGTGRVTCRRCRGRGRTNFVEMAMLPKGEWPKWCGDCRGSGLDFCGGCLGSGEKRGVIGFHIRQDEKITVNGTESRASFVKERDACEMR